MEGTTITVGELSLLLVEPSDVQTRIIRQSMADLGVRNIQTAGTIAAARDAVLRYEPDLVVSAMYLPDGTAEEFLRDLRGRSETEDQAFMLVSSVRDRKYLEALRQSGVLAILPKPFGADDLQCAIRATLDFVSGQELDLDYFDITTLRILLVDDSRTARKHIRRVLERIGANHFTEAENGWEATEILRQQTFDLVVTDYNMPEMDGRELTEFIRGNAAFSHLPILMVSSEDNQTYLNHITQAGVDAICEKPFDPVSAKEMLHRLLG